MSAANDILDAVKAKVEAAFPDKTFHLRRASDKNPAVWFDMDVSRGAFALSMNDDRPAEMLSVGVKLVKYTAELLYVTKELPGDRKASEGVENTLDQLSRMFLVSRKNDGRPGLEGAPTVSTCNVRVLAPYAMPFGDKTANVSRIRLEFESIEDA